MNPYELMMIINPTVDEEGVDAHIERAGRLIVDNGGEVTGVDKWGKKRFAYVVNDLTEGYYVVMTFKATGPIVGELGRVLRITDGVIRHLIVRLDEDVQPPVESSEPVEADSADAVPADASAGGEAGSAAPSDGDGAAAGADQGATEGAAQGGVEDADQSAASGDDGAAGEVAAQAATNDQA